MLKSAVTHFYPKMHLKVYREPFSRNPSSLVWELERLLGQSRALTIVPFNRPHTISYQFSIATMSLHCTDNKILSLISRNLKRSHYSEHTPFESTITHMHYSSCVSISTRNLKCLASPIPKIWLGQNLKKRITWPWSHTLGVVCHWTASTSHILPAHKIWQLTLQPFWRYERGCQSCNK